MDESMIRSLFWYLFSRHAIRCRCHTWRIGVLRLDIFNSRSVLRAKGKRIFYDDARDVDVSVTFTYVPLTLVSQTHGQRDACSILNNLC